ncbi:MAG: 4Fe-4S binding protein [Rhodospirillaceae bacterium]
MRWGLCAALLMLGVLLQPHSPQAQTLDEETLADMIMAPYALGPMEPGLPVYRLLDGGGAPAGYVFETLPLAPLPGFAGAPFNLLITLDNAGRFLEVRVLQHNEPVFVSGLGEEPMFAFVGQYRGLSLSDPIQVGRRTLSDRAAAADEGDEETSSSSAAAASTGGPVELDGVAKATAPVRIINETVLAAALKVAREHLAAIAPRPVAPPRLDYKEDLDWAGLLEAGIVAHHRLSNADMEAAFAGTPFAGTDPEAEDDPEGVFLDLWVADLSVPTVAEALLAPDTLEQTRRYVLPHEEGLLVMATGRAPLTNPDFVRNSALERLALLQGEFPMAVRDADVDPINLNSGVLPPDVEPEQAIILRADRRLGFDPASPWNLTLRVQREKGMFMPEIGEHQVMFAMDPDDRFYGTAVKAEKTPPWLQGWIDRSFELGLLAGLLVTIFVGASMQRTLAAHLAPLAVSRVIVPAITLGFIGWWMQAQLSIVTPLGILASLRDMVSGVGGTLMWLLYDPASLLVWAAAFIGAVLWGRGFFCGWLCPFGAFQELVSSIGKRFGLKERQLPDPWDQRLKGLKYVVLAGLCASVFLIPSQTDAMVEVEPFKTAITLGFDRAWPFVAWAVGLLLLSLVLYKGFCRYLCPLGAAMALIGRARRLEWVPRREACGSPCKLCTVRCRYQAISRQGNVTYSECFQCLDCVAIHDDEQQCVALILDNRKTARTEAQKDARGGDASAEPRSDKEAPAHV